jgi:iron(III) transport system substrate-binding protein
LKGLRSVPVIVILLSLLAITVLYSCTRTQSTRVDADLVVYTSHPDDLARTIVDEFRERTGLRVRVVSDGTGALLARLASGENKDADVLWGGGAESLVANLPLFEAYESPERGAIPPSLRDEYGFWTGFTVLPMVIIVNTRLVPAADMPRRWADLVLPLFSDSVAYANPASSGSAYTILRTMLVAGGAAVAGGAFVEHSDTAHEEAAWRLIEGFVDAIGGNPVEESALVYSGVAAGEFLAGVTYENAGAEAQRLGSDVRIVYPADGTSAVPDGVAILKGPAHRAAARRFVDFVLGYDVARVVTARFKRRSARSDAPVPEGLPPLETIRLLDYDFDASVSQREATIEHFRLLTGRY